MRPTKVAAVYTEVYVTLYEKLNRILNTTTIKEIADRIVFETMLREGAASEHKKTANG